MITLAKGNLFEGKHDLLVNPVNCVGVMGKGLALEFKNRYPDIVKPYVEAVKDKRLRIGNVQVLHRMTNPDLIINFPTKDHWKDASTLEYIELGLDSFLEKTKDLEIKSAGFPALGCGLGNLSWKTVCTIMLDKLSPLTYPITIYAPF